MHKIGQFFFGEPNDSGISTARTTPLRIALPFQPEKVSLNDNGEILAEIK